jgi:hypothetical protein
LSSSLRSDAHRNKWADQALRRILTTSYNLLAGAIRLTLL